MSAQVAPKTLMMPNTASAVTTLAALCKAAADPLRLEIMRVLSRESFGVQELASIFAVPQPGMSHHLKVLSKSGLLVTRRQGNSIFYRRPLLKSDDGVNALQASLYATLDALPLADEYSQRMSAVYAERSQQSREYFERNASKFAEQQGMLCELSDYVVHLRELLDLMQLPKSSRVMEVGPGQGAVLAELARRFDHLVALDNSGEMLALAQEQLASKHRKTEFINRSLEDYESDMSRPLHAVVLNMVMHHLSSPQRALQRLGEMIAPGGFLLVADLCSHNQEWARESCGDIWLGFDPLDLDEWAKAAGFETDQSLYLGLKNGFQIQLKLFSKI